MLHCRKVGVLLAVTFELALFQGRFQEALHHADTLVQSAQARGDSQAQAWGLCGVLLAQLRLGCLPQAVEVLPLVAALPQQELQVLEQLWLAGVVAVVDLARGQGASALAHARRVTRLARQGGATSVGALEGHAGAAQVYLTLWQRRPGNLALAAGAKQACQRLMDYAYRFPVAWPRAYALVRSEIIAIVG